MIRNIFITLFFVCLNGHAFFISTSIGESQLDASYYSSSKPYPSIYLELGFLNELDSKFDYKYSLGIRRYGFSYQEKNYVIQSIVVKPVILTLIFYGLMLEGYVSLYHNYLADEVAKGRDYDEELIFYGRIGAGYGFRAGYYVTESFLIALNYEHSALTFDLPAEFQYMHLSFQWDFQSVIDFLNPSEKNERHRLLRTERNRFY